MNEDEDLVSKLIEAQQALLTGVVQAILLASTLEGARAAARADTIGGVIHAACGAHGIAVAEALRQAYERALWLGDDVERSEEQQEGEDACWRDSLILSLADHFGGLR